MPAQKPEEIFICHQHFPGHKAGTWPQHGELKIDHFYYSPGKEWNSHGMAKNAGRTAAPELPCKPPLHLRQVQSVGMQMESYRHTSTGSRRYGLGNKVGRGKLWEQLLGRAPSFALSSTGESLVSKEVKCLPSIK